MTLLDLALLGLLLLGALLGLRSGLLRPGLAWLGSGTRLAGGHPDPAMGSR